MKLIFVCPTQNKVFESADFKILENRGVIRDKAGNKTLDAQVALIEPCPFCGKTHIYHANELLCPFMDKNNVEMQKGGKDSC
ncbi:MAG: hypothetical protein V2B20_28545 [Pseudomonadota bacterium]